MSRTYGKAQDLIDFTRASSATYLDSDGLLKTASNNIPRIEYDANGNLLGLLVEEQRSNVIPKSESFTAGANGWFTIGASTSANQLGLDGQVNTANIVTSDTSTGSHLVANGATFTSGLTYTGSVFLKKGTQRYIKVSAGNPATWAANVVFDLDLASVDTETSGTGEIKSLGNGWYRCSITGDALASASTAFVISMLNDSKLGNFTGTGAETVIVYGAQLEAGSFPTSYIPTSGSTATRSADVASLSTGAFGYNDEAGSLVVEYVAPPIATGDGYSVGSFEISSSQAGLALYHGSDNSTYLYSGSTRVQLAFGNETSGAVAIFYRATDNTAGASYQGNAVLDIADPQLNTNFPPSSYTKLNIGINASAYGSNIANTHIKAIKYYPRRLTNDQLVEVTS